MTSSRRKDKMTVLKENYFWVVPKNGIAWEVVWVATDMAVYRLDDRDAYHVENFEEWIPVEFPPEAPTGITHGNCSDQQQLSTDDMVD